MLKRGLTWLALLVLGLLTACASVSGVSSQMIPLPKDKLTFIDFYSDECPNCMIMQPIVDKLGNRYRDQMAFRVLNVDTDGKSLFESMGLRGNPVFLILRSDNSVVYKGYGKVPELALDKAIRQAIGL